MCTNPKEQDNTFSKIYLINKLFSLLKLKFFFILCTYSVFGKILFECISKTEFFLKSIPYTRTYLNTFNEQYLKYISNLQTIEIYTSEFVKLD